MSTDQQHRRSILRINKNPERSLDYISVLSGRFTPVADTVEHHVRLRYVPASAILDANAWQEYLSCVGNLSWASIEELTAIIVADANDQLVPRWIEVSITAIRDGTEHWVIMDDKQPGWDNEDILARLDSV